MVSVYLINKEQLGDRDFTEIPVADLQLEVDPMPLEEFQRRFNMGAVDARTQYIKFVAT